MEKIFLDHPWIVVAVLLWSLPWKGVALWIAARRGHIGWFLFLIVFNSLAIFDILYIFIFSKWGMGKSEHDENRSFEGQEKQEPETRQSRFAESMKNRNLVV